MSKAKTNRLGWGFIAFGLGIGVYAILLAVNHQTPAPQTPSSVKNSVAEPSSDKPQEADINDYEVAPDLPRYIEIPSIKVMKARVIQLGITADDKIAAPDNIYDAGWYENSAKPGQAGAMFIDGHVSSPKANGIFYNLDKLKPGDRIIITRGDNSTDTYEVNYLKNYPNDSVDMNRVLSPANSNKPGLNLMTCTGRVIPGTYEFTQRLSVFASLVN